MKKFLFILVSLVNMLCVSCGNDNSVVDKPKTIIGHWKSNIIADFYVPVYLLGVSYDNSDNVANLIYNYDVEFYFSDDKSVIIKLIFYNADCIINGKTQSFDFNDIQSQYYIFGTYSDFNNSIVIKLNDSEYSDEGDIYEIEYLNINSKILKIKESNNNIKFMPFEGYLLPNKNSKNFNYNNLNCDNNGYYTFNRI